jgi:hypothetical protein
MFIAVLVGWVERSGTQRLCWVTLCYTQPTFNYKYLSELDMRSYSCDFTYLTPSTFSVQIPALSHLDHSLLCRAIVVKSGDAGDIAR